MSHTPNGFLNWILDCIAPASCVACDAPGSQLCDPCESSLRTAPVIFKAASEGVPPIAALGRHDGALRAAVLALKFRGARPIGVALGRLLARKIVSPFDALVPVPLHPSRMRERGYNQALEIARGISRETRVPCYARALVRLRATLAQSSLDAAARADNVRGAFAAGPDAPQITGLNVLLIDDVVTTGATSRACVVALTDAGARSVYLAVAALRL